MGSIERFDIFISYRREGGYETAKILYDNLTQMRYRVSFDLETLRGGKFNTQLYQRIEQCSDVLAIMSKDSLNLRENPEDDWFRLEIAHALKHKKNIVPVFLRDFKFPQKEKLPPDIADLVDYQGVTASQEHFDSVLQRICKNFQSKPCRRRWPVMAAMAAVFIAVMGTGIWLNRDEIFPYPFTDEQKKQVELLSANMMLVGEAYNEFMHAEGDLYDAAERSILAGDKRAFDDAAPLFSHRLKKAREQFSAVFSPVADFFRNGGEMPVDYAGMQVFLEGLSQQLRLADEVIPSLERICDPAFPCEKADRLRMLGNKRQIHDIYSDSFSVSVMGLFCNISLDALDDFAKAMRKWPQFRLLSDPWLRDEKAIKNKADALGNKFEAAIGEMQTILGEQNAALAVDSQNFRKDMANIGITPEQTEKMLAANTTLANITVLMSAAKAMPERELDLYKKQMVEAGATVEQADAQIAKLREMFELKKKMVEAQDGLADVLEKARKDFAPKDDDDIGTLWRKMLRFMKIDMPEEAKLCVEALRRRSDEKCPSAALDVAEAIFFAKDKLPFEGGVLVCSYEPPATGHAIFRIGDVIAEVNGKPCRQSQDFTGKVDTAYTIYRRNAKGVFEKASATMPADQPRVLLVNLAEED